MSTKNKNWDDLQREFYNSRDHKRMWHCERSFFVKNVLDRFISFSEIRGNEKILEIGCGAGRYTIPLIRSGYKITGLDISERMLRKLKYDWGRIEPQAGGCPLICGGDDCLKAQGQRPFDVIIGFNVLHHLFDISEFFKRIGRYLRKDGVVAFVEPNALNPLHTIDTVLDGGWKAEGHKTSSTVVKVEDAIRGSGFFDVEHMEFGFFPPFLIDGFPALLNFEKAAERNPLIKKILPYFIIKGKKSDL